MVRMTSGILEFEPLVETLPVVVFMLVVSSIAVEVVSVPIRKIQCNIQVYSGTSTVI